QPNQRDTPVRAPCRGIWIAPPADVHRVLVGIALAMLLAPSARAGERLLARVPSLDATPPHGIRRVQMLVLGRAALAELRRADHAEVDDFPLAADGDAKLDLRRFEPFPPDARVVVAEAGRERRLPLPDHAYFTGTVRGDPASRVILIAARDHVRGLVVSGG